MREGYQGLIMTPLPPMPILYPSTLPPNLPLFAILSFSTSYTSISSNARRGPIYPIYLIILPSAIEEGNKGGNNPSEGKMM